MPDAERRVRMDVRSLLAAVERSAPVDVIEVLASELGRTVGASEVSLLIANLSGDALNRMSHRATTHAVNDGRNERAEPLPLPGSEYERVLLSQETTVLPAGDAWDVLVPVTERGDAIGILELRLPRQPVDEDLAALKVRLQSKEAVSNSEGAKFIRTLIESGSLFYEYDGTVKTIIKSAEAYVKASGLNVIVGRDKAGQTVAVNLAMVPETEWEGIRKGLGKRTTHDAETT